LIGVSQDISTTCASLSYHDLEDEEVDVSFKDKKRILRIIFRINKICKPMIKFIKSSKSKNPLKMMNYILHKLLYGYI